MPLLRYASLNHHNKAGYYTAPGAPCARSSPPVACGVSVAQCQQRIFTWFGQGSCKGLRYPTVLSYLVYSVPKFQSNCCAQKVKKQKQTKKKNKHKETKKMINMGHDSFKNTKMKYHEGKIEGHCFFYLRCFAQVVWNWRTTRSTSNKRSHSNGKFTYNSEMRKPKRNWQMYLQLGLGDILNIHNIFAMKIRQCKVCQSDSFPWFESMNQLKIVI